MNKKKKKLNKEKSKVAIKGGENLSVEQKKKIACTQRRRICKLKMALPV